MKRIDVSAVCIIPEMIFYKHLHSDLSLWHACIIERRLKAGLRIPVKLASIVSALLSFVGKWFASSKHSFGRM